MHDIPILTQLVIVLPLSALVVWGFQKVKLPPILGFLVVGVLVGPVFGLIQDRHNIEVMAEIGIVLLMFSIGVEFSLKEMMHMARLVFGGGGAQMLLTGALAALAMWGLGLSTIREAIFAGMIVSVSSTAIVLRLQGERGEMGAPHGRMSLAILLMQDLAVVLLMLLVPLLAGQGDQGTLGMLWQVCRALILIVVLYVCARFLFPWLMEKVVSTRSRELFSMVTIVSIFGTAYLAGLSGLSLALGAFVAGMVVSESPYAHQMMSEVLPFRDVFSGLFFVAVGMLVEPHLLAEYPLTVAGLVLGVVVLKAAVAGGVTWLFGLGAKAGLLVGLALAQVGEFAFVLAQQGAAVGLLSAEDHAIFVCVSVATMILTPFLIMAGPALAKRLPESEAVRGLADSQRVEQRCQDIADHVVIVGFGLNGRNVAHVLRQLHVRYVITELNAHTVMDYVVKGEPIIYGDATRDLVLEHVGIHRARALVVVIADPAATRQVVELARRLNPALVILARTRFVTEVEKLQQLGADHVVPEEFETSIEISGLVMKTYGASDYAVAREQQAFRDSQYGALRDALAGVRAKKGIPRMTQMLHALDVEQVSLDEGSPAVGQTLKSLNLRARTGVSVMAILRGGATLSNPGGELALEVNDQLVLIGDGVQLQAALPLLALRQQRRTSASLMAVAAVHQQQGSAPVGDGVGEDAGGVIY
jgi:monovalent cation:H+ antiporter-2, CPA2 family